MSTIINFLKSIGDMIITLVGFVIKFIEDILYMIKLLGETILAIPEMIGFLPSAVVSAFMAALSIVVIYKVLGRTE